MGYGAHVRSKAVSTESSQVLWRLGNLWNHSVGVACTYTQSGNRDTENELTDERERGEGAGQPSWAMIPVECSTDFHTVHQTERHRVDL